MSSCPATTDDVPGTPPLTCLPKAGVSIFYKLGLATAAAAMLLLPLLYVSLIVAIAWGVYLFAIHCVPAIVTWDFKNGYLTLTAMFVCIVTPIATGCAVLFFMIKPVFARRRRAPVGAVHNPAFEPRIGELIERVCRAVGAPAPRRIEFDCSTDASAGFAGGWRGVLRNRMVLRLGLSLVATVTERELAGILAHEFGHFRQGIGMRMSFLIRVVNGWFARVVYHRDAWDERLEETIESQKNWVGVMGFFASLGVMVARAVLWVFMNIGHGISAFLMRQMEFDADAAEIQLAGSDAFKSTTTKLLTLSMVRATADQQIAEIWHFNRHLPDNLPILLEHHLRSMPPEVLANVELNSHQTKTHWSATHPSPAERTRRAEAMKCSGQDLRDAPARQLFENFDDLCRGVTIGHYHNLGVPMASNCLVPVKVLVSGSNRAPARTEEPRAVAATIPFQFDQAAELQAPAHQGASA
jgi:Zn-dependent protease with chaperone function